MQSGTTGINTVRIYNVIKQSFIQDPSGKFIGEWVPELKSSSKLLNSRTLENKFLRREKGILVPLKKLLFSIIDNEKETKKAKEKI